MPNEKIVINASPLILLCKSGLERLLPELFTEIVVPNAVWDEIIRGEDIVSQKVRSASWLRSIAVEVSDDILIWNLGDGESEVLSVAFAEREFTAVVDDRAARNCAHTLSIKTLGTGAILVLAKKKKLIESVGSALANLKEVGLYISEDIVELLKRQAGE